LQLVNRQGIAAACDEMPCSNGVPSQAIPAIFIPITAGCTDAIGYHASCPILNNNVPQRKYSCFAPEVEGIDDLRVSHSDPGNAAASPSQMYTLRRQIPDWPLSCPCTVKGKVAVFEPGIQCKLLVKPIGKRNR
jgi:hypothetical protein